MSLPNLTEIVGKQFRNLTVLAVAHSHPKGGRQVLCLCSCGTKKIVMASPLISGKVKSCGCRQGTEYLPLHDRAVLATTKRTNGCIIWTGTLGTRGYGRLKDGRKAVVAHRCLYELLRGPIPDGLEMDHLCRNHSCVNPYHLEPVTHRENVIRGDAGKIQLAKTHCPRGHPYDYDRPDGARGCKRCSRQAALRHYHRNVEAERKRNREYYYRKKNER